MQAKASLRKGEKNRFFDEKYPVNPPLGFD